MEFHEVCSDFLFKVMFKHSQRLTAGRFATIIIAIVKAGKSEVQRLRAWSVPMEWGSSSAVRDR